MILAVLQRRVGIGCHTIDVYASTVGGARIYDPGADLALACALASAVIDQPLAEQTIAIGEIGLAGEVRRVTDLDRRLNEAARLGVTTAIIPHSPTTSSSRPPTNLETIEVSTLANALTVLNLRPQRNR
jgi:DNA repair protein RadA/Sms